MNTTTILKASWNAILNDMQRAREIAHECRHDDSSLRQRRLCEEAGIVGYEFGSDGVYVWQDNEHVPVEVEDPENISLYINVYHVERCYGGPEEGGWYYNAYKCEQTAMVFWDPTCDGSNPSLPANGAWAFFDRQLEKYRRRYNNEGRRPLHSVLSNGEWSVMLEAFPKESETTERPYYC